MTRHEAILAIVEAYECTQRETMSVEGGIAEDEERRQALLALGVTQAEIDKTIAKAKGL